MSESLVNVNLEKAEFCH
ncbi:hypothetical protein SAMN05660964_00177 [Thiothrix caldifontis]|uniref:Uncharacterized protein n=1 Tax=Thiothrix caldifontis TaxID=525918 RepID=A0A1H3VNH1_9GAMM|nr:hypothetical protein SAMN05660964_00177 [Thiothrix caldifontis]